MGRDLQLHENGMLGDEVRRPVPRWATSAVADWSPYISAYFHDVLSHSLKKALDFRPAIRLVTHPIPSLAPDKGIRG